MAVSIAESLAIVGVIIPGIVLLFFAATLSGKGYLSLELTLLAGWAGAFIGDFLSFLPGYFFHGHIRNWPLFRKYKKWINKGEQFFIKRGQLSVFIGRFAGPFRAILPLVAGMMGMSAIRFIIVDIVAGALWSVAYLLPGYLIGASMQWVDLISEEFAFTIIIFALIAWVTSFLYWKLIHQKGVSVYTIKSAGVFFVLFIILALLVKTGVVQAINEKVAFNVVHNETLLSEKIAIIFTMMGSKLTQLVWAVIICGSFWLAGSRKSAFTFGATIAILTLISYLAKYGLNIPRPSNMAGEVDYSFPSGHTAISAFLLFALAKKLQLSVRYNARFIIWGLAIFTALMIALSRLYLNMHWLTDVTGGFLLSIMAYLFWQYLENRVGSVSACYQPVLLVTTLIMVTAILSVFLYPSLAAEYIRAIT